MKFELYGEDRIHGRVIHLPACPRTGDEVHIDDRTFVVQKVSFRANEDYIVLTVEG